MRRREFITAVTSLVLAKIGNLGFMSLAQGQPAALTKAQSDALNAYNNAVSDFKIDLEPAARTDRFESTAAEFAGTSPLPCSHQHDERI